MKFIQYLDKYDQIIIEVSNTKFHFIFQKKKQPSLFILINELNLEDLIELFIEILKEHIQKGKMNKF